MTQDEAAGILYILQATYPNSYSKQTDAQFAILVQFWATTFKDYDAKIVTFALQSTILNKKEKNFPPTLGEINIEIIKMLKPNENMIDGETAWTKASELIKKYGHYLSDEQKEELNKELDSDYALKRTLLAVGGLMGIRICELDNLNTLRAQFIRIYNSASKTKQENLLLPDTLKSEIQEVIDMNTTKTELLEVKKQKQNYEHIDNMSEKSLQNIKQILKKLVKTE